MIIYVFSFLVAACLLESGETRQSVDFAVKSQLDEMVQSFKDDKSGDTKDYTGDLVNIKVDNNGNSPEYISFQVFFPKHVDILELNSKISGASDQLSSNEQPSSMLQHLASIAGNDLALNELQTTSTKLTLRGGKHLELFFNYDADKFVKLSRSKFTNQFLTILEFYSKHPETITIGINSANFGHGNYPKISIHRWLLSTLPGYSLTIDFKNVDLEENVDNIQVYSFNENHNKTHIKSIRSVEKLSTESNKILIIFTSDCSENHRGFNATVHVNRITTTTEPTNLNECLDADANSCSSNAKCTNNNGSYQCECNDGFTGNGTNCSDTDECASESTNDCNLDTAECINQPGNFTCVCKHGFVGDGRNCTDLNECLDADANSCSSNAKCTNNNGSYQCECNDGFTGNGTNCSGYEVVTQKLYRQAARSYCQQRGGDLIQFNPKLYTRQGRNELAASLNLPFINYFHTGIKMDPDHFNVWRRESDGEVVEVDGWVHNGGYPRSDDGWVNLYWNFHNELYKNKIYNQRDSPLYFICEFF